MTTDLSIPIGPDSIARRLLPNGMVALARENYSTPAVVVSGLLRVGSLDEPVELSGLSSFAAEGLMRGTESRSFAQLNEEIESLGADVGTGGSRHTTDFGAKCLVDDLDRVLDILSDVLLHPSFPAVEVEKLRGEVLTFLEERDNSTGSVAGRRFQELAYTTGHPYGRPVEGDPPTVNAVQREDLVNFYRNCYGPQGGIVVLVGALEAEKALDKLQAALGNWQGCGPREQAPLPPAPPITETRRHFSPMPGKSQADIALGWQGLARSAPDYLDVALANLILGGFGMMGRLGKSVRDEQGLAYYVFSRLNAGLGPGPWIVRAGVNPQNVEVALEGIFRQIELIRDSLVTEEELDDAVSYLIGSLPLRLETNEGMAQQIMALELHALGLDYLQRYPGLVRAITREQVQAAARAYLIPGTYALAIAGPSTEGDGG